MYSSRVSFSPRHATASIVIGNPITRLIPKTLGLYRRQITTNVSCNNGAYCLSWNRLTCRGSLEVRKISFRQNIANCLFCRLLPHSLFLNGFPISSYLLCCNLVLFVLLILPLTPPRPTTFWWWTLVQEEHAHRVEQRKSRLFRLDTPSVCQLSRGFLYF